MSKIYVKPYDRFTISGQDFETVQSNGMRRIVFTPDNKLCLSMVQLRDGCLLIVNENAILFAFTISRDEKVIAVVKFGKTTVDGEHCLQINSNWRLTENGLENWEIHTNPDLHRSPVLNIDLEADRLGRVDLKFNESGFGALVFSRELLFMKMNGNHTVPRLLGFIENEIRKTAEEVQRSCEAAILSAIALE